MKLVSLFFAMLVAAVSCDTPLNEFAAGNLQFTANLYSEVLKANPNKNFVFSPFSIEVILALTRAGAEGQTANEFTTALNLPSEEVTENAFKQFLPTLRKSQEDLKLLSANRLYLGQGFEFLESFKSLATGTFDAGIENVDFSKNTEAANTINGWVEQQTNNKIKGLISPNDINGLTRLILVNALYFSGKWVTPFDYILKKPFYLTNTKTKEVDMMHVEDSFKYYESKELNAKFLELPYLGGNVSMTIVLPNEKEGLSAIETNLESVLKPQNLEWQRVSVQLPSFLVESDLKLKPILKKLGLIAAFSDQADFGGLSKESLKIDEVIQKAFINVTKSGTEAAAATAVQVAVLSSAITEPEKSKSFIADHPYFYVIKQEKTILFAGKIVE